MSARFYNEPTLGDRVTNLRGGALPGLAATLRVAELLPVLVLVRNSEGDSYYLHRSLTDPGRWSLGSRTVAFAPAGPDGSSARPTGAAVSEATPPAPVADPVRLPQAGNRVALPDGTDSGYVVGEVCEQIAATGHPRWVLLRRVENRSFVVLLRPDVRANGYVLNGYKLQFLPTEARCCDLCEELFVPDDFGDPGVCVECADTDTVSVPVYQLRQVQAAVEGALTQIDANGFARGVCEDGSDLPSVVALDAALVALDKLTHD